MNKLKIIYKKVNDLIAYANNPRFNDDAVDYVAKSIEEFGFKVPVIVDENNVIVCGHTRVRACKQLKIKEVPCIIADDLTEDQIKAFRLADNKVSEFAEWDMDLLNEELESINDIDMEDFGFEFDYYDEEQRHEEYQEETQERVANILNLEKAQFEGVGKYDIPQIKPVYELGEIKEWIGFNYVLSDKDPKGKAVHFFIDDYQFMRVWNNPDAYIEKLKQYECVLSPDFSPYGDMPLATQIFNHYRKHWVGAYWQMHGIKVIPTIRPSSDERSLEFFLEGEPSNGIICVSSMWVNGEERIASFKEKYKLVCDTLKPLKVLIYGKEIEGLKGNIDYIESFTQKRWKNGEEK